MKEKSFEKIKPKEEMMFDPEKEITEEEWGKMKDVLEKDRKEGKWQYFSIQARAMKILFPERTKELNLNQDAWQGMENEALEQLKSEFYREHKGYFASYWAADMKILFPEKTPKFMDEGSFQGTKDELERLRKEHRWRVFSGLAARMKILFPERVGEFGISEDDWREMKRGFEYVRKTTKKEAFRREEYWENPEKQVWHGDLTREAASMKILFPERVGELNLDKAAWQRMRKELEQYRKWGQWDDFAPDASRMKILAAKKVEVDKSGLKVE